MTASHSSYSPFSDYQIKTIAWFLNQVHALEIKQLVGQGDTQQLLEYKCVWTVNKEQIKCNGYSFNPKAPRQCLNGREMDEFGARVQGGVRDLDKKAWKIDVNVKIMLALLVNLQQDTKVAPNAGFVLHEQAYWTLSPMADAYSCLEREKQLAKMTENKNYIQNAAVAVLATPLASYSLLGVRKIPGSFLTLAEGAQCAAVNKLASQSAQNGKEADKLQRDAKTDQSTAESASLGAHKKCKT